jgi:hypothetical protein
MSETPKNSSGVFAFCVIYLLILFATVSLQTPLMQFMIDTLFPNYVLTTDVLPSEWLIMNRDLASAQELKDRNDQLQGALVQVKARIVSSGESRLSILLGKRDLRALTKNTGQMLYFINPYIAILPLHLFFAGILAFLLSLFFPATSAAGWVHSKLLREYARLEEQLRKQFNAHDISFDSVFDMTPDQRETYIRRSTLPEVTIMEVEDYVSIHHWVRKEKSNPMTPIRFFFRYKISAEYGNIIQGLVSGGAAILIFVIGLRGLKLIPSEEPSLILMALSIEFILLMVLMVTFAGSSQEERLDRIMKELEAEQRDAIKQQTTTIHQVIERSERANPGVPVSDSIAEHEERKIMDDLLSLMLKVAEKK